MATDRRTAVRFTRRETLVALRELARSAGRPQPAVVHDLVTLFGPAYLDALSRGEQAVREAAAEAAG